jgi:hypothetical protein
MHTMHHRSGNLFGCHKQSRQTTRQFQPALLVTQAGCAFIC